jgi:hypothetical protein
VSSMAAVAGKLDADEKRAEQMMNAARIAGKIPELPRMRALNDERNVILKAGLEDLRARLSRTGRQALEKLFQRIGVGAGRSLRPPA